MGKTNQARELRDHLREVGAKLPLVQAQLEIRIEEVHQLARIADTLKRSELPHPGLWLGISLVLLGLVVAAS